MLIEKANVPILPIYIEGAEQFCRRKWPPYVSKHKYLFWQTNQNR